MRISDWSSDVCSSDRCAMAAEHLLQRVRHLADRGAGTGRVDRKRKQVARAVGGRLGQGVERLAAGILVACRADALQPLDLLLEHGGVVDIEDIDRVLFRRPVLVDADRSEEHTSELQSLMRISYAVFCLKTKKQKQNQNTHTSERTRKIAQHK